MKNICPSTVRTETLKELWLYDFISSWLLKPEHRHSQTGQYLQFYKPSVRPAMAGVIEYFKKDKKKQWIK